MPSPGQEHAAGDHFSFSSDSIDGSVNIGDEDAYGIAFRSWSERVKDGGVIYGTWAQWSLDDDDDESQDMKVQSFAKYQQEMRDLINDVPDEYLDELSFRDLVDLPRIAKSGHDSPAWGGRGEKNVKKGRNSSEGNGFFLKMFFPIPAKRRTSGRRTSNGNPRPSISNPSTRSESNRALLKDEEKTGAAKNKEGKRRSSGCIAFFQKSKSISPKI